MKGSFFKTLMWILKQEKQKPEIPKYFGFMANRWLSMATKSNAQIVNLTTNRWNYHSILDEGTLAKFYHAVIPKYGKKIEYIKKTSKETEETDENVEYLASMMEISKKELESYNDTLAQLNLTSK
jgi:hypothetical protein